MSGESLSVLEPGSGARARLLEMAFPLEFVPGARAAVGTCLRVQPEEKVTLISDLETAPIAASLAQELVRVGCRWNAFVLEDLAARPLADMPREVLAEGRYFHGIDSWERSLEFCVEELGEDMWLFASDWPHGDSAWPESVEQTANRPRLTESARKKILGENAMRLCPRLRS